MPVLAVSQCLPGQGDGTFEGAESVMAGFDPYWILFGYYTANGNPDLLTLDAGDGTITFLENVSK